MSSGKKRDHRHKGYAGPTQHVAGTNRNLHSLGIKLPTSPIAKGLQSTIPRYGLVTLMNFVPTLHCIIFPAIQWINFTDGQRTGKGAHRVIKGISPIIVWSTRLRKLLSETSLFVPQHTLSILEASEKTRILRSNSGSSVGLGYDIVVPFFFEVFVKY